MIGSWVSRNRGSGVGANRSGLWPRGSRTSDSDRMDFQARRDSEGSEIRGLW